MSYTDTNKDGIIQPRQYFVSECDGNWNPPFEFPTCIDNWKPGEIVEVNNYYPFGLMHNYTATTQNAYQYKYNDKELQETRMYDYGARFYMPDIGRWGVIDPMAEKYRRWSPYNYAVNNPIMFIDPDGRQVLSGDDAISIGESLVEQAKAYNAANAGKTDEISFFGEAGDGDESSLSSWMKVNIGENLSLSKFKFSGFPPYYSKKPEYNKTNPLHENYNQAITLDEWVRIYNNKSYNDILNERGKNSMGYGLGPNKRFVFNPVDGNVMDMTHVMEVGFRFGGENIYGIGNEMKQWFQGLVGLDPAKSAFNKQDFYSNTIGNKFYYYRLYETAYNINGNIIDNWVINFSKYFTK